MARRFDKLKNRILGAVFDQTDQALEILKDILSELSEEMQEASVWTGGLSEGIDYSITKKRVRKNEFVAVVRITDPVFNILDEGVYKVPRYASSYGLKAFPLAYPRSSKKSGSKVRHMTTPNSLQVREAKVVDGVLFRPVIYTPVAARNYQYQIESELRSRIEAAGLQVEVNVSKEKGDGE